MKICSKARRTENSQNMAEDVIKSEKPFVVVVVVVGKLIYQSFGVIVGHFLCIFLFKKVVIFWKR